MKLFFRRACLVGVPAFVCLTAGVAAAASRQFQASGAKLAIDSTCAAEVTIEPDPALSGHFVVDTTADHAEEIDRLVLDSSGETAQLHKNTDHCYPTAGLFSAQPTLHIAVRVPAGTPLAIDEAGGVKYRIGAVGGPLALDLSGGVEMQAQSAQALKFDISGGGQVTIGTVHGPIEGEISGGGSLKADHAVAPRLTLDVSGGGGFAAAGGQVDRVKIDLSGGGHVDIGGTVGDADVEVSGGGSVAFARVAGQLQKDVSGAGEVTVGGR
jgi:hypothetical protein